MKVIVYCMGIVMLTALPCHARPQFRSSWPYNPIVESSASDNWAIPIHGPFEPPIDPTGLLEYTTSSEKSRDENSSNVVKNDRGEKKPFLNDDYHPEDPQREFEQTKLITRRLRNNTRITVKRRINGNAPHVARLPDGTLKILYPGQDRNRPSSLFPMLAERPVLPLTPTRGTHVNDMMLGDDSVVFPGPKVGDVFYSPPVGKEGPRCANGMTFCETADYYPESYLNNVLDKEGHDFMELFGTDVVNEINITQRIDAIDEVPLCGSRESVVKPRLGQNKDNRWLFVINNDKYEQGVRVETCNHEGSCSMTFPLGYTSSCKQKYIYRKLVALNDKGEPYSDSFKLPSCCSCIIKLEGNIGTRMGFGSGGPMTPIKLNIPSQR